MAEDRRALAEAAALSGLPYKRYFPSGINGSGLFILSRYPFIDSAFHRFRLYGWPERAPGELDYFAGKGIGMVRVKTPAGTIELYDMHPLAQYTDDKKDIYKPHRAAAAFEAASFISAHSTFDRPVILTGDFNMRPDQFPYRLLKQSANLNDPWEILHPGDPAYTYFLSNRYSSDGDFDKRLDYVLFRSGQNLRLTPLQTNLCFNKTGTPHGYSDHYGVLTEFELEKGDFPLAPQPDNLAMLGTLEGLLEEALAEARLRRKSRLFKSAGGSLIGVISQLNRAVRTAGLDKLALLYALLQGWMGLLVMPEEINALEELLEEIRIKLTLDPPQ